MRTPRVRFREFLLLTTLASLIAATLALWANARYRESAMDHARRAHLTRVNANWLASDIEWSKGQMERQWTATDKAVWQARIKADAVKQSKAVAEAEHHERFAKQLSRYYEP